MKLPFSNYTRVCLSIPISLILIILYRLNLDFLTIRISYTILGHKSTDGNYLRQIGNDYNNATAIKISFTIFFFL